MRRTFALLSLAVSALGNPMPQGVTSAIAPSASAPAGCMPDYSGTFQITVVNVSSSSSKRDLELVRSSTHPPLVPYPIFVFVFVLVPWVGSCPSPYPRHCRLHLVLFPVLAMQ